MLPTSKLNAREISGSVLFFHPSFAVGGCSGARWFLRDVTVPLKDRPLVLIRIPAEGFLVTEGRVSYNSIILARDGLPRNTEFLPD